jgi:polar amino acid transport system substrate-binding protein
MKQVVQNYRTGELKVEDVPPPALRLGGVLIRTAFSLISAGTERTIVSTAQSSLIGKARSRPDLVRQVVDSFKNEGLRATYEKVSARLDRVTALGYSASGSVIAVADGVEGLTIGDQVACAGAGYASHSEVLFVPQNLCCRIPEGSSLESACYTTVGSIALHGVRQSDARLGESVAVVGLGLVGQLTVQILKAAGCRVLGIDLDPAACELAKASGADFTSHPGEAVQACLSFTRGRGADCILITAGTKSNDPVELAGKIARDRARVVVVGLVGMDLPRHIYYEKEIELRLSRSYGPGRYDPDYEEKGTDYPIGYVRWTEKRNMEAFLRLIADGKVDTALLTTHRFPVERAIEGYDLITARERERYCGVVLEYPQSGAEALSAVTPIKPRQIAKEELGVGFIGAGSFARGVLLPIIQRLREVQLLGVSTATGISAKSTAERFGFSFATTDYNEVLGESQTNCVFIATRHDSHARLATEALNRGLAVFVEKPLATTIDDLNQVITTARTSGGLLMVGFNRRFAPLTIKVKDQFNKRAGPMTIIYRINAGRLPANHWTLDPLEGGGRIVGEVCHFVDFIQFVTDATPLRVSAQSVSSEISTEIVDDSVTIQMSLSDGSIASIIYAASGDKSVGKEQIEVFCDGNVASIDDFQSASIVRSGKRIGLGSGKRNKGHGEEIAAFLKAARGAGEPPISLESLELTTKTCLAIVESVRDGRVVAVNEIPNRGATLA